MATPHTGFPANAVLPARKSKELSWVCFSLGVRGPIPLTLPTDACTASKGWCLYLLYMIT
jgi:hypothetical protein